MTGVQEIRLDFNRIELLLYAGVVSDVLEMCQTDRSEMDSIR